MEFDCGHFGVFENAIDMAHIHYLHGDSFGNEVRGLGVWVCGERGWGNVGALAGGWWGWLAASFDSTSWLSSHANVLHCRASAPICWLRPACLLSPQGKPEIRDMQATSDVHSVTATFTIHNKPVNAFWALFQVGAEAGAGAQSALAACAGSLVCVGSLLAVACLPACLPACLLACLPTHPANPSQHSTLVPTPNHLPFLPPCLSSPLLPLAAPAGPRGSRHRPRLPALHLPRHL